MIAIAERAGVAAGTLYRHFSSKEELFVELFRSVCDREVRAMRRRRRGDAAPTPRAPSGSRPCWRSFAERALRRPRLAWALIAEPVDPRVDAERLAYRERYAALIADTRCAGHRRRRAARAERRADRRGACRRLWRGARRAALAAGGERPAPEEVLAALRTFVRRAVGAAAVSDAVRVERDGPVYTVLPVAPERRNAVDGADGAALAGGVPGVRRDPDAAVAVLHGEGGVFCAGADLKAVGTERGNRVAPERRGPDGADADAAVASR